MTVRRHSPVDDARLLLAQAVHAHELPDPTAWPAGLLDLGLLDPTIQGVQDRMSTLVTGALLALNAILREAATYGLSDQDLLRAAGLRLARQDD